MKRLVVCCDGTWQSLDNRYPTNVLKIAQAITQSDGDGVPQVVFYDSGVGTVKGVSRYVGGALGAGIDDKIQSAYRFLSLNYAPGDEVFLFGFSRGAYTVRSLAGLIYKCGLVRRNCIHMTGAAYELYRLHGEEFRPSGTRATGFRQQFGDRIPIKVLGCWDTVGSLGVPEGIPLVSRWFNERYRFYDTTLNPLIEKAFHAVAIDEIRKVFNVTPMNPHEDRGNSQVLQVWFPGEHSCVGGGVRATRGLSDAALEWMLDMAASQGLAAERSHIQDGIDADPTVPFDNSPGLYRLVGIIRRSLDPRDDLSDAVWIRRQRVPGYDPPNLAGIRREPPGRVLG
jgi:uncharacterized protein (DUF2235 family)